MDEIKENYSDDEAPEPIIIIKIVYSSSTPAAKRAAKKWRDNNLEQYREINRNIKYNKYHRDPEYKAKILERNRLNYKKRTEKNNKAIV
jgi:hypothetical protein